MATLRECSSTPFSDDILDEISGRALAAALWRIADLHRRVYTKLRGFMEPNSHAILVEDRRGSVKRRLPR